MIVQLQRTVSSMWYLSLMSKCEPARDINEICRLTCSDDVCRLEQQQAIKQAAAQWDPEHQMRRRVFVFSSLQEAMDYLAYISYRLYTTMTDRLEATQDKWAITVAEVRRERQLPHLCQATLGLADIAEPVRPCDYQTAYERLERIGKAYTHGISEIEN